MNLSRRSFLTALGLIVAIPKKALAWTAEKLPAPPHAIPIQLNRWREVKFTMTDLELAHSDKGVASHAADLGKALGEYIDQQMVELYKSHHS